MRIDILQAIGLTALAGVIIGGVVVVTAIAAQNEKKEESTMEPDKVTTQPPVTERVMHQGWEEIEEDEFAFYENLEEGTSDFKVAYFTLYSDGYGVVDMPDCSICITPDKMDNQNYIPQRILDTAITDEKGVYWRCYDTKHVWMISKVTYSFEHTLSWPQRERDGS